MASVGCTWNKELDDARLQADECRLELQNLRAQATQAEDVTRLRAQRDRLAAENQTLKAELAKLRRRERDLQKKLTESEKAGPEIAGQLETQGKELHAALENLRRSRQQWEETLADRQRQIEVLKSHLARLAQELADLRTSTPAATTGPRPN
ncbi:MAG TPA: hypothetical protein VLM89_08415 [Phycisphaerae bacterium]|nr:hypothetical protein [Phycisphaerae bacterium]